MKFSGSTGATMAALMMLASTASAQECIAVGSRCTEYNTPDNCCNGSWCRLFGTNPATDWMGCTTQGTLPDPEPATNTFEITMTVQENNLDEVRIFTKTNLENPPCVFEAQTTGQITQIPGPWSSQMNKLESNDGLFMWQEKTGVEIPDGEFVVVDAVYEHNWESDCGTFEIEDIDYSSTLWCGSDFEDAANTCSVPCPTATDQPCLDANGFGSRCFADVDCSGFGGSPPEVVEVPEWQGALQPGTKYNSYIVHGDTLTGSAGTFSGSITFFGQTIVGVMFTKAGLESTDALFGMDDTIYPTKPGAIGSTYRGFELGGDDNFDMFKICRTPDITLNGASCPETAASECEATVNLGAMVGPASGANAYVGDYPKTDISAALPGPNGRDDSIAFLTLGNYMSEQAAEIEGRMVVGGDMIIKPTGANSLVQAGYGSGIIPNAGTDIILVGGSITVERYVSIMETGTAGGNVVFKGTYNDNGVGGAGLGLGAGGQLLPNPDLDLSMYIDLMNTMAVKSAYWATLSPNGIFVPFAQGPNGNTMLFKAGPVDACVQIFNVDATDLSPPFGVNVQFDASLAGKTILINVNSDGGLANIGNLANFVDPDGNGGFDFGSQYIASILWNFHDAAHVELGDDQFGNGQFRGSVLVPFGSLRMTMPGQSGRMLVSGDIMHDVEGSEFHNYKFEPPCPLPSPPDIDIPDECETPAPFAGAPPSETGAPTMAPTPYQCPEDLELLMKVGDTDWVDDGESPIVILEQGGSYVTFRIRQEYTESVNFMYVLFDQNVTSDEICYTNQDVEQGETFTYTAMCTAEAQVTMVEIWVADDSFSVALDIAEVPECCHAPDTDTYPKVQYCFELHCVTQCPDDEEEAADEETERQLRGILERK
eukprot:CAMPEP_0119549574 /NCGR_PEP_ID=MMETSP1352-20130426/3241_1 /TAXON_ID=265584 /ORGANISM="Stauroneis constricta, Strain CCMP1120" /LENGTH=880 /DNA_ID=CAMNT_0007595159 /DNA_START=205 /DNA_END=2847 /DNA_ORIENTATION=-